MATNGPSIDMALDQVIRLVQGFLLEHNLVGAARMLELESGCKWPCENEDIAFIRELVLDAHWDEVEELLSPLSSCRSGWQHGSVLYHLRKQRFLELFSGNLRAQEALPSEGDVTADGTPSPVLQLVAALKRVEEVCPTRAAFNSLCYCLTLPAVEEHPDYAGWWTPYAGRQRCFEAIRAELVKIFPDNTLSPVQLSPRRPGPGGGGGGGGSGSGSGPLSSPATTAGAAAAEGTHAPLPSPTAGVVPEGQLLRILSQAAAGQAVARVVADPRLLDSLHLLPPPPQQQAAAPASLHFEPCKLHGVSLAVPGSTVPGVSSVTGADSLYRSSGRASTAAAASAAHTAAALVDAARTLLTAHSVHVQPLPHAIPLNPDALPLAAAASGALEDSGIGYGHSSLHGSLRDSFAHSSSRTRSPLAATMPSAGLRSSRLGASGLRASPSASLRASIAAAAGGGVGAALGGGGGAAEVARPHTSHGYGTSSALRRSRNLFAESKVVDPHYQEYADVDGGAGAANSVAEAKEEDATLEDRLSRSIAALSSRLGASGGGNGNTGHTISSPSATLRGGYLAGLEGKSNWNGSGLSAEEVAAVRDMLRKSVRAGSPRRDSTASRPATAAKTAAPTTTGGDVGLASPVVSRSYGYGYSYGYGRSRSPSPSPSPPSPSPTSPAPLRLQDISNPDERDAAALAAQGAANATAASLRAKQLVSPQRPSTAGTSRAASRSPSRSPSPSPSPPAAATAAAASTLSPNKRVTAVAWEVSKSGKPMHVVAVEGDLPAEEAAAPQPPAASSFAATGTGRGSRWDTVVAPVHMSDMRSSGALGVSHAGAVQSSGGLASPSLGGGASARHSRRGSASASGPPRSRSPSPLQHAHSASGVPGTSPPHLTATSASITSLPGFRASTASASASGNSLQPPSSYAGAALAAAASALAAAAVESFNGEQSHLSARGSMTGGTASYMAAAAAAEGLRGSAGSAASAFAATASATIAAAAAASRLGGGVGGSGAGYSSGAVSRARGSRVSSPAPSITPAHADPLPPRLSTVTPLSDGLAAPPSSGGSGADGFGGSTAAVTDQSLLAALSLPGGGGGASGSGSGSGRNSTSVPHWQVTLPNHASRQTGSGRVHETIEDVSPHAHLGPSGGAGGSVRPRPSTATAATAATAASSKPRGPNTLSDTEKRNLAADTGLPLWLVHCCDATGSPVPLAAGGYVAAEAVPTVTMKPTAIYRDAQPIRCVGFDPLWRRAAGGGGHGQEGGAAEGAAVGRPLTAKASIIIGSNSKCMKLAHAPAAEGGRVDPSTGLPLLAVDNSWSSYHLGSIYSSAWTYTDSACTSALIATGSNDTTVKLLHMTRGSDAADVTADPAWTVAMEAGTVRDVCFLGGTVGPAASSSSGSGSSSEGGDTGFGGRGGPVSVVAPYLAAAGAGDYGVRVWDTVNIMQGDTVAAGNRATPLLVLRGHTGVVHAVKPWSADGRQLVSASADGTVRIWDCRTTPARAAMIMTVSDDRGVLKANANATAHGGSGGSGSGGRLEVHALTTRATGLSHHSMGAHQEVAVGCNDGSILVLDAAAGRVVASERVHRDEIRSLSSLGPLLLSASFDGTMAVSAVTLSSTTNAAGIRVINQMKGEHSDKILCAKWHHAEAAAISSSADRTALLWKLS